MWILNINKCILPLFHAVFQLEGAGVQQASHLNMDLSQTAPSSPGPAIPMAIIT